MPLGTVAGEPVAVASGQFRVMDLVATADHVYWTDYGEDPTTVQPQYQYGYYYDPTAPGVGMIGCAVQVMSFL
jgi:hypothetical protein